MIRICKGRTGHFVCGGVELVLGENCTKSGWKNYVCRKCSKAYNKTLTERRVATGAAKACQRTLRGTPTGAARVLVWNARNHTKTRRAKGRAHTFELTKADEAAIASIICNGKCQITGLPFNLDPEPHNPLRPTLDRIDNDKGYTLSNIAVVCSFVNMARREYHYSTFKNLCLAVARRNFPHEFKKRRRKAKEAP